MLLQASNNNNNLATINQQISNLGSINQQLTSLSHQLSGLNQQSQQLQNYQNTTTAAPTLQTTTPTSSTRHSQLQLNLAAQPGTSNSNAQTTTNQFPYQLQPNSTELLSKDLFQVNQELLNRLQALNLGNVLAATTTPHNPHTPYFYVNPMSSNSSTTNNANNTNNNNNSAANNYNFLSSANALGNLTPSPMGTLTRHSYSNSPTITEEFQLSLDKQLANSLDAMNSNSGQSHAESSPSYNTVTLKVTDEAGNVTNQRKLSATPSFITRSTSEKVPNRSQMMSQVQRTAWARHTTK